MSWSGPTVSLSALLGGPEQPWRDSANEARALLASPLRIEGVRGVVVASGIPEAGLRIHANGWLSVRRTWEGGVAWWTADFEVDSSDAALLPPTSGAGRLPA